MSEPPARSDFGHSRESSQTLWPSVIAWAQGHPPSASEQQQMADWELEPNRAAVWQVSADHVVHALKTRAALLQTLCQQSPDSTMPLPGDWTDWIIPLWTVWLPLAQWLDKKQRDLGRPWVQGILGGQGTGKTTLTKILRLILGHLGHQTAALSIDDLYLTHAQRCELRTQDPRLIWRGPPGTHDIELGQRTLRQIKNASASEQITLPQFDKSLYQGEGDRTRSLTLPAPTIVLFEGWFVGTRPVDDSVFSDQHPLPDPIHTAADRQFARDSNRRLQSYLPLWDFLNSLLVLYPNDYRQSQKWRQQAEQQMKAQGKEGLGDRQITAFVTYFWKALHPELFITPALRSPDTSLVVKVERDHSPSEVYSPSAGRAHFI